MNIDEQIEQIMQNDELTTFEKIRAVRRALGKNDDEPPPDTVEGARLNALRMRRISRGLSPAEEIELEEDEPSSGVKEQS